MNNTFDISTFGKALLTTGDLDPVYLAIESRLGQNQALHRLCISYWCFYHLGVAARMAEESNPRKFWQLMKTAAVNETRPDGTKPWPRGAERRHFRGANAVKAVDSLAAKYKTASEAVSGMIQPKGGRFTYNSVAASAMSHEGFGPWIAFKIADMSERVLGYGTDFHDCHLGIYRDPRQGAACAWLDWKKPVVVYTDKPWETPISDDQLADTVRYYVSHFSKVKNVPGLHRPPNVQEVETIFCKWKSHLKGHYPVGKDAREILHGLDGWGDLAQEFRGTLISVDAAVQKWITKGK